MTIPIHPVCKLFPDMTEEQFKKLVDDIREHGQREPILVHKGKIIDGRNRYRACQELGIEPNVDEWHGEGSLVHFVVSKNLHRRHLNPSQRAAVATDMLPMLQEEARRRQEGAGEHGKKGGRPSKSDGDNPVRQKAQRVSRHLKKKAKPRRATDDAAKATGASSRQVQRMSKVRKQAPELQRFVKSGDLTVAQAERLAAVPKKDRTIILKRGKEIGLRQAVKEHTAGRRSNAKKIKITTGAELDRLVDRTITALTELAQILRMIVAADRRYRLEKSPVAQLRRASENIAAEVQKFDEQ